MTDDLDPRSVEQGLIAYYDQEADHRANRQLRAERVAARDTFLGMIDPGVRLIELGPGAGRDAAAFIEQGIATIGVDLSFEQISHASAAGASGLVATARQLPFPDHTFDALWSMSVLMHVPNSAIVDTLTELRRVLAPGATAAIGVWGGPDVEDSGDNPDDFDPPRLFSRRSDDRWRSLLATLGTVEVFENWHPDLDDFGYQWAIIRAHR